MTYTEKLFNISWNDLPPEVKKQTKRCIRDILATAAAATLLPDPFKARRFIDTQFAKGHVPLWFQTGKSAMIGAAFYNSFLVDSLDYHDGFRPCKGHAGATVVPVAIASCSGKDVSGTELLTAVLMGYEIACRAGQAVHDMYKPAYHSSGSWASLGAAVSAAMICKFNASQIDRIVGMAEYYSPMSPMIRCTTDPCCLKDGAAVGAWSAAMAIQMYQTGFSGLPSILTEEEIGRKYISTLTDEWLILKQYFKPYPTCRWTHPALEAAVYLKQSHGFTCEQINTIEVYTFKEATSLMYFPPANSHQAQYSLPWSVAAGLIDGQLSVEQVHPDKFKDKRILSLGQKISVHYNPSLQKDFPAKCLQKVKIFLNDGRIFESSVTAAKGDYDKPLSDEELNKKFIDNLNRRIGKERAAELLLLSENLERYRAGDMISYLM